MSQNGEYPVAKRHPYSGWIVAATMVLAIVAGAAVLAGCAPRHNDRRDDIAGPAATGGGCTARKFKIGEYQYIVDSSPNGRYLVGTLYDENHGDDFGLWHDGRFSRITGDPVDSDVNELDDIDVNDSGVVVGENGSWSWRYADGDFQYLRGPDGSKAVTATAIANDGTIVGASGNLNSEGAGVPLRWAPGKTRAEPLPFDKEASGGASDVSADGTIMGYEEMPEDTSRKFPSLPVAWNATGKEIWRAPEDSEVPGYVQSINGDWALLSAEPDTEEDPLPLEGLTRVNLRTGKAAEVAGIDVWTDGYIDEHGTIYGLNDDANAARLAMGDTKPTVLPGLAKPPNDGESHDSLDAISADGSVIVGSSATGSSQIWTCH